MGPCTMPISKMPTMPKNKAIANEITVDKKVITKTRSKIGSRLNRSAT
jgi:hypothetical protein